MSEAGELRTEIREASRRIEALVDHRRLAAAQIHQEVRGGSDKTTLRYWNDVWTALNLEVDAADEQRQTLEDRLRLLVT